MTDPVFGIKRKHDTLTDLDFADGIALLSDSHDSSQDMTTKLQDTQQDWACVSAMRRQRQC